MKKIRDQVKKLVKDLQEAYFYAPPEVWRKDMEETALMMEMLADLVKRFAAMLREKKAERNMIDFNDNGTVRACHPDRRKGWKAGPLGCGPGVSGAV